jgi:DNA-binding NtrC family response regulator
VGGLRDIEVDLRVIAATNQDLEAASLNGEFRRDLFFRLFLDYLWPGNVRELKNALERAMIFEKGRYITSSYLPFRPDRSGEATSTSSRAPGGRTDAGTTMNLEEMERELLIKALKKASGNKSQAARILGITRDTLRYKIQKWDLKEDDWLGPA